MKMIQLIPQGDYSENERSIIDVINTHVFSKMSLKDQSIKIVMENLTPMGYQLIATLKVRNVNVEELQSMFDKVVEQRSRGEEPAIEAQPPYPTSSKCACWCESCRK